MELGVQGALCGLVGMKGLLGLCLLSNPLTHFMASSHLPRGVFYFLLPLHTEPGFPPFPLRPWAVRHPHGAAFPLLPMIGKSFPQSHSSLSSCRPALLALQPGLGKPDLTMLLDKLWGCQASPWSCTWPWCVELPWLFLLS